MTIEITDGVTTQRRKLKPSVTVEQAEALLEEMWMNDDMGYSYYLLDENGDEIGAFEH